RRGRAAGVLAAAAGVPYPLAPAPDRDISVPEPGPSVEVTVVGLPPECGTGCHTVVVRYAVPPGDGEQTTADPAGSASGSRPPAGPGRRTVEGLLVLSQQTLTQRGQRLLAVAD